MKTAIPKGINIPILLILIISTFLSAGCQGANIGSSSTSDIAPSGPVNLEILFPQNAPRVGEISELKYFIKASRIHSLNEVKLSIIIPDGIQLIDGDLTTFYGSMSENQTREAVIHIKPIRTGNYTFTSNLAFFEKNDPNLPLEVTRELYLSVDENSSKWGTIPPWDTIRTPIQPTRIPEKAP
jgi:hypothetical protein